MYGQEPQAQLTPTSKPVHAVFPRDANDTCMGKVKRYSSKSHDCATCTDPDEANEERFPAGGKQWRLIRGPNDDGEVRRAKQERCYESPEGTKGRWFYSSDCATERRQSTALMGGDVFPNLRNKRQGIHKTNNESFARLSRGKLKWCPLLWELVSLVVGLKALFQQWYPSLRDTSTLFSLCWSHTNRDPL